MMHLNKFEAKLFKHGGEEGGTCSHGGIKADIPSFEVIDLIVKEDVQAKARELADLIGQSEEVLHYRRAEAKIQGHERVQSLIQAIKKKQKEAVAFEKTFNNPEMVAKIEAEMSALQDELDGIPIVTEFQQSQSDINYLLQLVVSIIRDSVAEKLTIEDAAAPEDEDCMD